MQPNAIMNEVQCFYEILCNPDNYVDNCEINELTGEIPKLSEEQQVSLEGEITLGEAGTALEKYEEWKKSRN